MKNVRFRYTKFSYEFYRNNDNALKEKNYLGFLLRLTFQTKAFANYCKCISAFYCKTVVFSFEFHVSANTHKGNIYKRVI